MLVVLVECRLPRRLPRRQIEFDAAGECRDGRENLARDLRNRTVRCQRAAELPAIAVLDDRLVCAQIQGDGKRTRAVRRREWEGLPAAGAEPKRGVLQLRLGRSEGGGELAEKLRVRVQGVAGLAPGVVRQIGPLGQAGSILPATATLGAS